ncbi:MAG: GNAT family N-acetyltransferase [Candidatus Nezhaarchaeales archaeon]
MVRAVKTLYQAMDAVMKDIEIRKLHEQDLEKLTFANGYTKWVSESSEKAKVELKELILQKLKDGYEVWAAIDGNEVVGFVIVGTWYLIPGGKTIEAVEVAKPYRGKGIGFNLLSRILKEEEGMFVLSISPEAGYEKALEELYKKLEFVPLTEDYMVRFPSNTEKIERWIRYLARLNEVYATLLKVLQEKLRRLRKVEGAE